MSFILFDIRAPYEHVVSEDAVRVANRLLLGVADHSITLVDHRTACAPGRGLTSLRGLGREIWRGVDPDRYVSDLRDEWSE